MLRIVTNEVASAKTQPSIENVFSTQGEEQHCQHMSDQVSMETKKSPATMTAKLYRSLHHPALRLHPYPVMKHSVLYQGCMTESNHLFVSRPQDKLRSERRQTMVHGSNNSEKGQGPFSVVRGLSGVSVEVIWKLLR